jgi:hypothetical protein
MMYEMTVPPSIKALKNLSTLLEKGAAFADSKKVQGDVLPNARLAIDQFALTRQVQIACDTLKLGAARLSGATAPSNDDTEKTLGELQTRIQSTIKFLETLSRDQFKDASTREITNQRWEGKSLTGEQYALHHMLPNLYFHVTTAYSILRHNGVDIGKQDYLGKLPFKG